MDIPLAHLAQDGDLDQLILAGFRCAGFPVVNGLGRDLEDGGQCRRRQAETLAVFFQAIGAEADRNLLSALRDGRGRLPALLAFQRLNLLFEHCGAALEFGDLCPVTGIRFPESVRFALEFLADQSGDFLLEHGCNVCHGGVTCWWVNGVSAGLEARVQPSPDVLDLFRAERVGHRVLLPLASVTVLRQEVPGALPQFYQNDVIFGTVGGEDRGEMIGVAGFSGDQLRSREIGGEGDETSKRFWMRQASRVGNGTALGEVRQKYPVVGDPQFFLAPDQVADLLPGLNDSSPSTSLVFLSRLRMSYQAGMT